MPSSWETTTLGAVSNWLSGGTPKKDEPKYWGGDIPWISANSMYGTRYSESELRLTEAGLQSGSRLAPKDTVLLLVRGGALHKRIPVGIAIRDVAFNQDVKALVAREDKIRPWYLLLWLLGMERHLLDSVVEYTGIGAGKLDTKRMHALEIQLPSLSEQDEIIAVVKSIDDRIELLHQTNTTLESIAQALFKSWFVDFDPVRAKQAGRELEGMDAATAALFPPEFEESALGLIPKGWVVGTIEDLLVLQRGFDLPASQRTEGLFPVLAASGPSGSHHEAMAKGPGVTTGRSGVIGNVYFVHEDFWPLNTSLWVKEFRLATPIFAYQFLKTLDLKRLNAGSAVPTLNRNHVHAQPALLPSPGVIAAYTSVVSALFAHARANEERAETLSAVRDTLLPRLISGKLRISEEVIQS